VGKIRVRCVPGEETFELVHPRCAEQRAEDLEEVYAMLETGEAEVAVDELRWLLEGCNELLEAHMLLGKIALDDGDLALARVHAGYAYELGLKALPKGSLPGVLPYGRPANRAFFSSGQCLARCLVGLGERELAGDVVARLLALDPSDPLALKELLERQGG